MRMNLKRSRKSNRVSWAPAVNLCQVKLFSTEDCPVKVGRKDNYHFKPKASYMLQAVPMESDLPPGFEDRFPVSQSKVEVSHIPRIQWKCPSKFVMNDNWLVAAGEESKEAKTQKLREMRVLEAVYPRFSAIPANPFVSLEVEAEHYDDSLTPSIPMIPIEEESPDSPPDVEIPVSTTVDSQQPLLHQGLSASKCNSSGLDQPFIDQPILGKLINQNVDVTAAASAALTAILKSTEKASLIDTGLLIKILSDPKMIQKLINEPGIAPNTLIEPRSKTTIFPSVSDMPRTSGGDFYPMQGTVGTTLNTNPLEPGNYLVQLSGLNLSAPSPPLPSPESNFVMFTRRPNQNQIQPTFTPMNQLNHAPVPPPVEETGPVKDMNYYKTLIMQHGVEKQEKTVPNLAQNGIIQNHLTDLKKMAQNTNPGELKPKNAKRCMYFERPKGCRNGVNCNFQHDMPFQWRTGNAMEVHGAKRMKINGGYFGRT